VAFAAGLDLLERTLRDRGTEQVVEHQRPILPAGHGHLDPYDNAAAGARRAREPIDIGHDLARRRDFDRRALGAEDVLHVDNHQRGLARLDALKSVQTAAAKYDAIDHVGWQLCRMHGALQRILCVSLERFSIG